MPEVLSTHELPILDTPPSGVELIAGNPIAGSIGSISIRSQLDDRKPVTIDYGVTETDELLKGIDTAVKSALDVCEFDQTPEIIEAIEGYYTDHMYLKAALSAIVEGRLDSDVFSAILSRQDYEEWEVAMSDKNPFFETNTKHRTTDAPNARVHALRLAKYVTTESDNGTFKEGVSNQRLLRLANRSIGSLYAESSVGISTLSETEIDSVARIADSIKDLASRNVEDETEYTGDYTMSGNDIRHNVSDARNQFWQDVRHAGQLLFHGSTDIGGINMRGLMSRNEQLRQTGVMNNQTMLNFGGDTMHSVVPHFSEFYGLGQYSYGAKGGTLAIPLAKIIEKAPYARDAKYGFAAIGPKITHEIPFPILENPVDSSGPGEYDSIKSQGRDRVFFASPNEASQVLPDNYSISMFDKNNLPATYIIMREPVNVQNFVERELRELGVGYGFPERLIIDAPGDGSKVPTHEDYIARDKEAALRIVELQNRYLEAYKHMGVVVPLRRGVFAQVFENMPPDTALGRPIARVYNTFTKGTGNNTNHF